MGGGWGSIDKFTENGVVSMSIKYDEKQIDKVHKIVKLNGGKYYDIENDAVCDYWNCELLFSQKGVYFYPISSRNIGKSYQTKLYTVSNFYKDYKKNKGDERKLKYRSFWLRRWEYQSVDSYWESYFSTMTEINENETKSLLEKITNDEFNNFKVYRKKIWLTYVDSDGNETKRVLFGEYGNLQRAKNIKSMNFNSYKYIIFEEIIPGNGETYLSNKEPYDFMQMISTIARSNEIKVFMIGNQGYECEDIYINELLTSRQAAKLIQETGKIYSFTFRDDDEKETTVVIEHCSNNIKSAQNNKFAYGKFRKDVESSEFKQMNVPILNENDLKDESIYRLEYQMFVKKNGDVYRCQWFFNRETSGTFWMVNNYTKNYISKKERIISDERCDIMNPLATPDFSVLFDFEKQAFNDIELGRIYYTNSRCGTNFRIEVLGIT